jgi:hypothetical protein
MKKIRIYLKKLYAFLHKMPGWIWLIPILILAVNVRLTYLTKADIWHDEGYTAAIIQQPIRRSFWIIVCPESCPPPPTKISILEKSVESPGL